MADQTLEGLPSVAYVCLCDDNPIYMYADLNLSRVSWVLNIPYQMLCFQDICGSSFGYMCLGIVCGGVQTLPSVARLAWPICVRPRDGALSRAQDSPLVGTCSPVRACR